MSNKFLGPLRVQDREIPMHSYGFYKKCMLIKKFVSKPSNRFAKFHSLEVIWILKGSVH